MVLQVDQLQWLKPDSEVIHQVKLPEMFEIEDKVHLDQVHWAVLVSVLEWQCRSVLTSDLSGRRRHRGFSLIISLLSRIMITSCWIIATITLNDNFTVDSNVYSPEMNTKIYKLISRPLRQNLHCPMRKCLFGCVALDLKMTQLACRYSYEEQHDVLLFVRMAFGMQAS